MHSWRIPDIKKCMNCILRGEAFDEFLLAKAVITNGVSYVIDGHLTKGFYAPDELEMMGISGERCMRYGRIRPLCFDMIKGKRTPQSFQFIFLASADQIRRVLEQEQIPLRAEDIGNLSLTIRYVNQELVMTCSATLNIFTPDKTMEEAWQRWLCAFLKDCMIPLEQMV